VRESRVNMSNQEIVDIVEEALPSKLPKKVKEKVLDAVFQVLNDEMGIDLRTNA
jgi:hypothetical protein